MNSSKDIIFKEQVKKSFSACRDDIEELKSNNISFKQIIEKINTDNEYKNSIVQNLQSQISTMQQTQSSLLQEIQFLREEFSNLRNQTFQEEVKGNPNEQFYQSNNKIKDNSIKTNSKTDDENPKQMKREHKKDPYEALLEFKAKTNKRELVKQKILTTVPNGGMILSELRFLFVEHFNYCSKATFYNYLKELEYSRQIRIEREHSKNIVYLQGISSSISSKEQHNSHLNI